MNSSENLVSVIIPVYNQEKFVGATIRSVISQKYNNWELLIVDDCSTDRSWNIIRSYEKKDTRIKIFKNKKNRGLIKNWKFLIKKSKGEIIAFLEGDDIFYEENLSEKIQILREYPLVNMVYCNLDIINSKGCVILKNYYKKYRIKTYKNQKIKPEEYLLSKIAPFSTYSQIIIRKNVIKEGILPRSLNSDAKIFLPSDWDYNFRVSTQNRVFFIDNALLGHRKHNSNNSADMLKAAKHYDLLFKNYEDRFKKNLDVLKGISYQRGKIKYFIILYYLDHNKKLLAWREFIKYILNHPKNILYDFEYSVKLLIRLLLPEIIDTAIINKYYGRKNI